MAHGTYGAAMSDHPPARPGAAAAPVNEAPQTLEGHFVLHDAWRVRWSAWRALPEAERAAIAGEAATWLAQAPAGHTGLYSQIGQKGDLVLLHYRSTPDDLNRTQRGWQRLRLAAYLEPAWSYVSVIEASLYEATAIAHRAIADKGLTPGSAEHQAALDAELAVQRKALDDRVRRTIPAGRYLCFYPMDKRRGEQVNWYHLPMDQRRALMRDHGRIGHKYHGRITQVVGGSIGFDDWEWGVTLHSDDVVAIKRLITEMRFDPSSSLYAEFGAFHLAIRQDAADLPALLAGDVR
jgi:chlorite dismutase